MEHRAFTSKADGIITEIRTQTGVFLVPTGQTVITKDIEQFEAIWDTGASNTAVSSKVINQLGSKLITFRPVNTGNGLVNAPVHLLNIMLPNNVIVPNVRVTELQNLNSCHVLIGMDIISQGDFAITHASGKACFSFRMPSHKPIDFVPESNLHNLKLKRATTKTPRPKRKKH
ncbi:MAG TPA: retropepsin-like aspartic protease [Magnetospirillaceae bacterium]|nr:retropepsin-like aspartic protease [Magnetospirillaceae bacterium]